MDKFATQGELEKLRYSTFPSLTTHGRSRKGYWETLACRSDLHAFLERKFGKPILSQISVNGTLAKSATFDILGAIPPGTDGDLS